MEDDPPARRLTAVDLFSGAGGLTAGLRRAGYEVAFGIDHDADACASFKANHRGTDVECGDITKFAPAEILRRAGGQVDVVVGGPSCQGFSSAGRRNDKDLGWIRVGDERNDLWKHQLEIVGHIQPRAFLLENVPGFMSFKQGTFGAAVLAEFRNLGYDVYCEILLAADFGLPQLRRRMFIVGLEKGAPFAFPKQTHLGGWRRDALDSWEVKRVERGLRRHITCWESLSDLPLLTGNRDPRPSRYADEPRSDFAWLMRARQEELRDHELIPIADKHAALIRHVPPGGTWRDIPPHLLPDRFRGMRRTDSTNLLGRIDPGRPSYTLTTQFHNVTTGCHTHPFEDRSLSIREGARLQSFRDDYKFVGSISSKCRQIGNAVPPRLAQLLGVAIAESLLDKPARRWLRRPSAVNPAKAVPTPPSAKNSARLRRQPRIDTKPEVQLRKALHARGFRFRVNEKPIPDLRRTADVVMRRRNVAIFVDGCFWHGCPKHSRPTKSNTKWWADKIKANKERDAETTAALEAAGWTVLRVWEHEDPEEAAARVERVVRDAEADDYSSRCLSS